MIVPCLEDVLCEGLRVTFVQRVEDTIGREALVANVVLIGKLTVIITLTGTFASRKSGYSRIDDDIARSGHLVVP